MKTKVTWLALGIVLGCAGWARAGAPAAGTCAHAHPPVTCRPVDGPVTVVTHAGVTAPQPPNRDALVLALERQLYLSLPAEHRRLLTEHAAARNRTDLFAAFDRARTELGTDTFELLSPIHQRIAAHVLESRRAGRALPALCFAQDTPPETFRAFQQILYGQFPDLAGDGSRFQLVSRWSSTATDGPGLSQGQPTTLTYSFAPDGTFVPNLIGVSGNNNLIAFLNSIYGNPGNWQPLFDQVFDRWAQVAGLSYVFEPNDDGVNLNQFSGQLGVRGDVRIAGIFIDGNSNTLAYNNFPNDGDMVIDTGDSFYFGTGFNSRGLRNVVAHEHGHGMGLAHVCPANSTKLMEPSITFAFDGPQHDDLRGSQFFYGDPFESDNSFSNATDIGLITEVTPKTIGTVPSGGIFNGATLSIDANGEQDWFRFTVDTGVTADVTVTPVGFNYDNSPQSCGTFDGCCSGNFFDSLDVQNLAVQIYDTDGTTVLGTASSQPAGVSESLTDILLPFPGDYFIRVFENGSGSSSQLYRFTVSVDVTDCNLNGIDDECDLDCGAPGCGVPGCGQSLDCNGDDFPDECDPNDCNENGIPDSCDVAAGTGEDCNLNNLPDDCDIASGLEEDCNANGIPDDCDVQPGGTSDDCNSNGIPDDCELTGNDCNANNIPDDCDLVTLSGTIAPPVDTLHCPGDSTSFTVSAPGATGFQWFRNFTEQLNDGGAISGATTATLTIDPVAEADDLSTYSCRVSFGCLDAFSADATLDVISTSLDVELLSLPVLTGCANGGLAIVQVSVSDPATATYQWSKDGQPLTDDGRISGTTTDTLQINDTTGADSGAYTCAVLNSCLSPGEEVTTTGLIDFIDPVFPDPPQDTCAEVGTDAVFTATADSPEAFVVRWYEGDTLLTDGGQFSGTTTDTLTVSNVQLVDDGREFRMRAIVLNPPCFGFSPSATMTVAGVGQCPACVTPGDMDNDGDFDLADMGGFAACFGADVNAVPACACANVDSGDNLVDLNDWSAMELLIAGPN
jgi:hypothetical protein